MTDIDFWLQLKSALISLQQCALGKAQWLHWVTSWVLEELVI